MAELKNLKSTNLNTFSTIPLDDASPASPPSPSNPSPTLPHETFDPGPPPDGGLRAWLQVLAGHLINALTWGLSASFGVYQLHYTESLHLPPSQISWIGSMQLFLTFFLSAFSGRLADAGYARPAVLAGCVLAVLGTFMTALATKYWEILLAQGLCTGLGMGIMFMPAVAVVGSYFQRKKSMALLTAAAGSCTGSIIFPAVVQYLTPQIGFLWAVNCSGFIMLLFAIAINLLLRPRLPPRKSGPLIEWDALREPPYVLFAIGMFLIFWAIYFGFFYVSITCILRISFAAYLPFSVSSILSRVFRSAEHLFLCRNTCSRGLLRHQLNPSQINAYARQIVGLSDLEAVNLLLIFNAVGLPLRPILGYVSDRWLGPINTLIPSSTLLGLMLYCWIAVRTRTGLYPFVVIYGIATGATQGIFVGALASLTRDPSKAGTRFGMVASVLAFASLSGPPIAGALIERDGGKFVNAQIWAGTVVLLGSATLGVARVWETGWRFWAKV